MNITKGPVLIQFAEMTEIEIQDVVDWVNSYVNSPHLFEISEETEQKRLESIKKYITNRLASSVNARIRRDIQERKAA